MKLVCWEYMDFWFDYAQLMCINVNEVYMYILYPTIQSLGFKKVITKLNIVS